MMRDDVLRRKMRACRPEPTPEFSGSMRKALSALQKKTSRPAFPRLVPVSAVVFAAVAVLCVLALNNKTIVNFFASVASEASQQQAAGGDATAPEGTLLPTPTPTVPDATALMQESYVPGTDSDAAKRNCALGNVCEFTKAVKTGAGIDYIINGQTTEGLSEYCDGYYKVSLKNPMKCELDPKAHPDLIFVLVDGLVDKNFADTIGEKKLNQLIDTNKDDKQSGVYVQGISATIEFSDNWETFVLTIHNANPDFRLTSNFTILTRYTTADGKKLTVADYDSSNSGKVQYYALQVRPKGSDSSLPTPNPSTDVTNAPQGTPMPTDKPNTPEITAMPPDSEFTDYARVGVELMKFESLGTLRLGMLESDLIQALGQPDDKTALTEWGSDGLKHSTWSYHAKDLQIGMAISNNDGAKLVVCSIKAGPSCGMKTQRGVKAGDIKDDVLEAYGFAIDPRNVHDDRIIAGTDFGGIVFLMKDGKVTGIFIGASAE